MRTSVWVSVMRCISHSFPVLALLPSNRPMHPAYVRVEDKWSSHARGFLQLRRGRRVVMVNMDATGRASSTPASRSRC
ncbi:hypothetical protein F5148DRAFT_1160159 [Russula earlei]|uniref:Uncharacterized protein n=1 Tax=Russula earlei TaxID=71964 RepID=A0ACC0UP04_9AGAM|nr:hypothetical protein F5148DRAFT_1160159 [Russula earlei]